MIFRNLEVIMMMISLNKHTFKYVFKIICIHIVMICKTHQNDDYAFSVLEVCQYLVLLLMY